MRSLFPPIAVLLLLTGFTFWNASVIENNMTLCISDAENACQAAYAADWSAARHSLAASHSHWQNCRSYLCITVDHSVIDAADSMYTRAMAFAATEEITEFQAETAGLRIHLLQLANRERFHPENIF